MAIMTAPRETKVWITDPYTDLKEALDSLKAEHTRFRSELKHFYDQAKDLEHKDRQTDVKQLLVTFSSKASALLGQIEAHTQWEEIEFFPLVELYGNEEMRSLEVLEKEHQLFIQHMKDFFSEVQATEGPIEAELAETMLKNWYQAYFIIKEHLDKEEQVILPYVEQMLTDIEQFYS